MEFDTVPVTPPHKNPSNSFRDAAGDRSDAPNGEQQIELLR